MRFSELAGGVALAGLLQGAAAQPDDLTFERRLKAQETIERVYYAHQISATRPFEEAVPRAVLEKKVRTYLKQSVALETFWKSPVTGEMLRRELERMAGKSRMPERLRELYASLGNDPTLIQECLARPALVDRLARSFFAGDATLHSDARQKAEALRGDLARGRLDPRTDHPARMVVEMVRDDAAEGRKEIEGQAGFIAARNGEPHRLLLSPDEFDRYREQLQAQAGEIGPVQEERESFVVRAVLERTGNRMKVATFVVPKRSWDEWWESVENGLEEASVEAVTPPDARLPLPAEHRPEVSTDSTCLDEAWDDGTSGDLPDQGMQHTAVWTGSQMIVWGGLGFPYTDTGGRYDPATDTWAPMSAINAPSGRRYHTAIWTGKLMIVWGGDNNPVFFDTGGRYDPATDTWTSTSMVGAPSARTEHTAVWTGSRMIVWGGWGPAIVNTGGLYDPDTDTWLPTSTTDAPSARYEHSAVWTGTKMVVWGGGGGSFTGGRYDPATDTWAATSTTNAPSARRQHSTVWTGSRMIVWGGYPGSGSNLNTGGQYDPAADLWSLTSTINAPVPRRQHTAVWAGGRMIVWGGYPSGPGPMNTGGRYDPLTDTWAATSMSNVPSDRFGHSAISTGSLMIVWGGTGGPTGAALRFNDGGRYDPATDTWTPTTTGGVPFARGGHRAVWTGSLMVMWGGIESRYGPYLLDVGGRYNPATDTWTPTSATNAPSPRTAFTAVWTGDRMIVWGGGHAHCCFNTGGLYDPVADTWTPTSTITPGRESHSAVWTGNQMIVWGGWAGSSLTYVATGSRYDPTSDTWTPISTANAPTARNQHSAVWTGSRMVVWGGRNDASSFNTGGRYDPATDIWTPTSTLDAPSPRTSFSALWTGSRMVVWGGYDGAYADTGGQYDPATDTWTPTSATNAPSPRYGHAAVWTGEVMIVWGGYGGVYFNTGGRYDPDSDTWIPTSTTNTPLARFTSGVWTGSQMIVWGGSRGDYTLNSGGRYTLAPSVDDDGDGFNECAGDCNDGDAAVHPGAVEVCDGLDNDCDDVVDNAPVPVGSPSIDIELSLDSTLLMWSPVGLATAYDVVRGDLSTLRSSGGDFTSATQTCSVDDAGGTSLSITDDSPAVGSGFWYLARAVSCGGNGTYDSGGPGQAGPRDPGINAAPSSCP